MSDGLKTSFSFTFGLKYVLRWDKALLVLLHVYLGKKKDNSSGKHIIKTQR